MLSQTMEPLSCTDNMLISSWLLTLPSVAKLCYWAGGEWTDRTMMVNYSRAFWDVRLAINQRPHDTCHSAITKCKQGSNMKIYLSNVAMYREISFTDCRFEHFASTSFSSFRCYCSVSFTCTSISLVWMCIMFSSLYHLTGLRTHW